LILVSACLIGMYCRYDGATKKIPLLEKLVDEGKALPICPEQLGELPIPRQRAEIKGGSGEDVLAGRAEVYTKGREKVTREFLLGAKRTLALAKALGVKAVILKAKSPSCGYGTIYSGDFSGKLTSGKGVTSALLEENGIKVFTEEDQIEEMMEDIFKRG